MALKLRYSNKNRSYNDAEQRTTQSSVQRDGYVKQDVKIFKPVEGSNILRILPPTWDDARHYGLDIHLHYNVGVDGNTYLCNEKMKGEACPICEERSIALSENDEARAYELRASRRILVYLFEAKTPEDIKVWAMPWTLDRDIMAQAVDKIDHSFIQIDDPEEGYTVTVTKEGAKRNTTYTPSVSRRKSKINLTDEQIEFLNNNPLPSILTYYSYEHIAKAFNSGMTAQKKEEEEEEEPNTSSRLAPRKNATTASTPASVHQKEEVEENDDLPFEEVSSENAEVTKSVETKVADTNSVSPLAEKLAALRQKRTSN